MNSIKKLQEELAIKEHSIQKLMEEKRMFEMKFDQLECQNNMVMDNIQLMEKDKEQSDKINESL